MGGGKFYFSGWWGGEAVGSGEKEGAVGKGRVVLVAGGLWALSARSSPIYFKKPTSHLTSL